VADGLLKRLGIDVPALTKAYGGAEATKARLAA
jgi:spermidine dehydrogenase